MKIAILGAGNMGSWLYHALRKAHEVRISDRKEQCREGVPAENWFDGEDGLREFQPDLFVNAVTLQNTVPVFEAVGGVLPKDCILADLTSIKGKLPDFYGSQRRRFVSVHPMFGPTFARMEALGEENAIVIRESDDEGKRFFETFFDELGVRIFRYTFAEHDEMMSYSLTTPFVSSLVFAACLDETAVPGTTFARHRKIAQGLLSEDDHLLAEVLFNPHSVKQLERITAKLEFLKHIIRDRDMEEASRFFRGLRGRIG